MSKDPFHHRILFRIGRTMSLRGTRELAHPRLQSPVWRGASVPKKGKGGREMPLVSFVSTGWVNQLHSYCGDPRIAVLHFPCNQRARDATIVL
jgi:hypothetical protein